MKKAMTLLIGMVVGIAVWALRWRRSLMQVV